MKEERKQLDFAVKKYEVTSNGKIISYWGKKKTLKGKLVKGYFAVDILTEEGRKQYFIHRLVAENFVDKPESNEELVVVHEDFNKRNNKATNLKWLTKAEALKRDSIHVKSTLSLKKSLGRKVYKLNQDKVDEIRQKMKDGVGPTQLAKEYDVSMMQLWRIKNGKNWKEDEQTGIKRKAGATKKVLRKSASHKAA